MVSFMIHSLSVRSGMMLPWPYELLGPLPLNRRYSSRSPILSSLFGEDIASNYAASARTSSECLVTHYLRFQP